MKWDDDNISRRIRHEDLKELLEVAPLLAEWSRMGSLSRVSLSDILVKHFPGQRITSVILCQAMLMLRTSTTGNDDPQGTQNYPGLLRGK